MYRTEELKDNLIAVSFTKRLQPFTLNKNAFGNFVNCLEKYEYFSEIDFKVFSQETAV